MNVDCKGEFWWELKKLSSMCYIICGFHLARKTFLLFNIHSVNVVLFSKYNIIGIQYFKIN